MPYIKEKAGRQTVISVIGEGSNVMFCQVIINRLLREFPSGTESPVFGAYFESKIACGALNELRRTS